VTELLICVALRIEARALRHAGVPVVRTGVGPRRAAAARLPEHDALAVVGFGGAVGGGLRPGDLLVASEVRFRGRTWRCPSAGDLAAELRRDGLPARVGPLVTSDRLVTGRLDDALAVDMETGALVREERPFAAVRAIVDTPESPWLSPGTRRGGLRAYRALCRAGPGLRRWVHAVPREVLP
jgi:4-hydroxy-3-methylbut-2-en-1-yl diphosphate reductase